jgi:3-dehydroquinate dehydratase type I
MATSPDDNITLLSLLGWARQQKFPLIAFCMGEMGKISRLATLALGGYMTYASPGRGRETAPGQISAFTLRQIMDQMGLS